MRVVALGPEHRHRFAQALTAGLRIAVDAAGSVASRAIGDAALLLPSSAAEAGLRGSGRAKSLLNAISLVPRGEIA